MNFTKVNVTVARREYASLMNVNPSGLPCGDQDALGDAREHARGTLREALIAHGNAMLAEGLGTGRAYLDEARAL